MIAAGTNRPPQSAPGLRLVTWSCLGEIIHVRIAVTELVIADSRSEQELVDRAVGFATRHARAAARGDVALAGMLDHSLRDNPANAVRSERELSFAFTPVQSVLARHLHLDLSAGIDAPAPDGKTRRIVVQS